MPVVTASSSTCPTSCPLKGAGCYAESGPLAIHWDAVTKGSKGGDLATALKPVRRLPKGTIWRYGQAGDLPGEGDVIDSDGLRQITAANRGKRGIVFTHKPPTEPNLALLRSAAGEGLTVNLSANSMAHADELADTGLPVVTVLPSAYARLRRGSVWLESLQSFRARLATLTRSTPRERKIAVCPATYTDTTCQSCGVCSSPDRKDVIIGFPAHGTRRRLIDLAQ